MVGLCCKLEAMQLLDTLGRISEPVRSTPTTVKLTVTCTVGISGFTLGVIY
jgi:hypothetical protein